MKLSYRSYILIAGTLCALALLPAIVEFVMPCGPSRYREVPTAGKAAT